ncbi:DUF2806 domain-containing protein [Pararhizobium sp. LjRoot235]|uniref:DUF2806 domain-containing protein n=1 Tax=Pararhizobium sp. LjRoot235 TaxID=3342291 RepID=UPI003ECD9E75
MSEDHLSSETSISAELTETGVKASAKSRAVAAFDRLLGGVADIGNAWLEGVAMRRRAKNEGERQLIEATAKYGVERMGIDDEFASRAFDGHFRKVARQQLNKDAVVAEALEDLRQQPPSDADAVAGPAVLSDEFMDRFEQYAEGATTEELRQRWGRVLSSEVRVPGTFSAKVLRATDELDSETAKIFERICGFKGRENVIFKQIAGELNFHEKLALTSAGLIADPGITGHLTLFIEGRLDSGDEIWIFPIANLALGFKKSCPVKYSDGGPVVNKEGKAAVPAYVLTDVGAALSTILPWDSFAVFREFAMQLKNVVPEGQLLFFKIFPDGRLHSLPSDFV